MPERPTITIDNEVYAAIRADASSQVLDPDHWPDWNCGDRWYEIPVDSEVREALGEFPNDALRVRYGLPEQVIHLGTEESVSGEWPACGATGRDTEVSYYDFSLVNYKACREVIHLLVPSEWRDDYDHIGYLNKTTMCENYAPEGISVTTERREVTCFVCREEIMARTE